MLKPKSKKISEVSLYLQMGESDLDICPKCGHVVDKIIEYTDGTDDFLCSSCNFQWEAD